MIDWTTILLTAIITTFLGILATLFTKYFIDPYFRFKDKLIQIESYVKLGEYILTSSWHTSEIGREEFKQYILNIQRGMRKEIADLNTFYNHIPCCIFSKVKLPSKKEMKELESQFYGLANASIIHSDSKIDKTKERDTRKKSIENIIKFVDKYS